MKKLIAWLVTGVLVCGCHRSANVEPTPEPPQVEAASDSAPPSADVATQGPSEGARPATATERAAIEELARAAESVRQLRLRRAVTIEIEDGSTIAESLHAQIDETEIERARVIYGTLGLVDPGSDLRSMFAGVLGEQVIGYYDPETGRLVVREDVMSGLLGAYGEEEAQEARFVLVHELVHALQDQRLGLGDTYDDERSADAGNAFRAVVEGDATLAMLAQALREQGIPLSVATEGLKQMGSLLDLDALVRGEKLDDAPPILRVTLVAPYLRGLQFIAAVQGRGGWPAVNNAHRRPPSTTEQVLHPDKYFAREAGESIEVRDSRQVLSAGFTRIEEDTLGELELSVYLGQRRSSGTHEQAAAGWAGDRLVIYGRGVRTAAVWWTTWDTEDEAEEAYQAARAVTPRTSTSRVERKGRAVLIVRGLPNKLHRGVRGDFTSFARRIKTTPPPPERRPSLLPE